MFWAADGGRVLREVLGNRFFHFSLILLSVWVSVFIIGFGQKKKKILNSDFSFFGVW